MKKLKSVRKGSSNQRAASLVHIDHCSNMRARLQSLSSLETAAILQRFFKTGAGQYGEGDVFLGIKVPQLRKVAVEFADVSLQTVQEFLRSKVHEERALALIILVRRFARADESIRQQIYDFYLAHTCYINNWDLVDGSAPYIVGPFLRDRERDTLYVLARSTSLWERRIAIISTFYFIRQNDFADTVKIAALLLYDEHDLIHKAVGWMLREIGKRDLATAESFLKRFYRRMPRTMLRYSIERFPESQRQKYLHGTVDLTERR